MLLLLCGLLCVFFFFFKQKTAYEMLRSLVGSEMCIRDSSGEVTITIGDKSRWDGGYGTDAMRTVCRFGFEMMNLHRIELHVFAENARARRAYQKAGFREEGYLRECVFKYGRYMDDVVMGMLEGELLLE